MCQNIDIKIDRNNKNDNNNENNEYKENKPVENSDSVKKNITSSYINSSVTNNNSLDDELMAKDPKSRN